METDNHIHQEHQPYSSNVASMDQQATDSLLPMHIYQKEEKMYYSQIQTVSEKKEQLVYMETVCSLDSPEGEDLYRYNYLLELRREGGAYRIREFITEIEEEEEEEEGKEKVRKMWKGLREVESVQTVNLPEEEQQDLEGKLNIRHVQSMQERMQNWTIRNPIQHYSLRKQILKQYQNTPIPLLFHQQDISNPLEASFSSKVQAVSPSNSSFPHWIEILIISNTASITPPSLDQNPMPSLNLNQRPTSYEFQRELFYSNTPSRIVNTQRFISHKNDRNDQNLQQIQALLSEVPFPQKDKYPLSIEQVNSERRLKINDLLPDQKYKPKRQKPKLHLNFQYQRSTVPFQEQLKFNIEKDFPKVPQTQMHSLPLYEYKDASCSSYPYNSFTFPQSEFNLPSPSWQYKQNLKETPRMTYPYSNIDPRLSFQTPNYSYNGYQHINQQRTFPQVAKNVKISLYSPKAPKVFPKETQKTNRVIKLRSPPRDSTYRSKDKANIPDVPKNEQNYTQPSHLSPKKQKLRLVQKPKTIQNSHPIANAVPQKQVSIFTHEQPRPMLQIKQTPRPLQKIKMTLRNPPKPQKTFLSDQSAILIQYQQHQIPISLRIN